MKKYNVTNYVRYKEDLKSYKPGKPIHQIIEEYSLRETAILWNNENNFGTSPLSMKQLQLTLSNSHLYPDPACMELRALIAKKNSVELQNVAVGNGSESIFNNLFNSLNEIG